MTPAGADRAANIAALECVSQLLQAEHRRDLIRYRARLHDDIVIRLDEDIVVQGADEAALLAAHEWALAPEARISVHDIGVTSEMVTVSYDAHHAVLPGTLDLTELLDLTGHSVFEVQDDKIIRIWHHFRASPGAAASGRSIVVAAGHDRERHGQHEDAACGHDPHDAVECHRRPDAGDEHHRDGVAHHRADPLHRVIDTDAMA